MDPERAEGVAVGYSSAVVAYIATLVENTPLASSDITLPDLVCALVYMLKEPFSIDGVTIITADPLLAHYLPPASHLSDFGYKKTSFTQAKTAVRCAIAQAIRTKQAPPTALSFPAVRLAATLASH